MFNDVNIKDFQNMGFTFTSMKDMLHKRFYTYKYTNASNGGGTDIDPNAVKMMRKIQNILTDHLVKKYYKDVEVIGYDMWQGVPPDLKLFHNDHVHKRQSWNSNIFIFLDECESNNMNYLEVRAGPDEFYQVIPNRGDIIWLNQSEQFTYKMIHTSGKNRILDFRYYINGLDNKTN